MDWKALKDEIVNDPANVGYKNQDGSWKADVDILGLITAKNISKNTPLPLNQFYRWAARHDSIRRMQAQQTTAGAIGSICVSMLGFLNAPAQAPLDFNDAEISGMLTALVQGNVFTQAEADDLKALAMVQVSRADMLGLESIGEGDINHVRVS